jgi:3-phenylpropionate/cinnamic acid dioxygenase small subunit
MSITDTHPVPAPDVCVGVELHHDIEQFLYFEARLLDDRRFEQWWQLFTDDVQYRMPIRYNRTYRERDKASSGPGELATFDEDKMSLYRRVYRLGMPTAWAEDPPSRTRHLVTNVWARPGDAHGEFLVNSAFLVYRNRGDYDVDIWAGSRDDVLRRSDAGWQIARRTIRIEQSTVLTPGLSIFF